MFNKRAEGFAQVESSFLDDHYLYRNVMIALKESCPDDWKDLLLEDFLAPLRDSRSRSSVKHKTLEGSSVKYKTLERTLSLTGANDDTVVEVKQYILLF